MSYIGGGGGGGSSLTLNTTPIIGGVDKRLLYDNAGTIGETAGITFSTPGQLNFATGASSSFLIGRNSSPNYNTISFNGTLVNSSLIGFSGGGVGDSNLYLQVPGSGIFQFQNNLVDTATVGVFNGVGSFGCPYIFSTTTTGLGPGLYATLTGDVGTRFTAGLDANNIPYCGFGPGNGPNAGAQDALLYRTQQFVLAAVVPDLWSNASGAGFHVYNKWDFAAENFTTNWERAVFDFTTATNVLSIGTQQSGTGVARPFQFIYNGSVIADFSITHSNAWTFSGSSGTIYSPYLLMQGASGGFPGVYIQLTADTHGRMDLFLDNQSGSNVAAFVTGSGSVAEDTGFARDAAGIFAIYRYNSLANPAGLRVYNTLDVLANETNYERGIFDWTVTSNVLTIGSQAGGTGTLRPIVISAPTMDSLSSVTVDGGAGAQGGGTAHLLITSSTSTQTILGAHNTSVGSSNGNWEFGISGSGAAVPGQFYFYNVGHNSVNLLLNGTGQVGFGGIINNTNLTATAQINGNLGFCNGTTAAPDVGVSRSASGVIAFGNGSAGDGSATILAKTKAGAPIASDVPAGAWALIRDTTNATTKMYYNNAGTLQTVALV
jgi:hypothetical protein